MSQTQVELLSERKPEGQIATMQDPNPMGLIERLFAQEGGVTAEGVAAIDKLVDLQLKMMQITAERDYATAFSKLQAEMPKIVATRAVPNNDGTARYKFAPYEDIMEQVQPFLKAHGFTVSFSMELRENCVVQTCTLTHISGHSKTSQFMARVSAPPKANETQAAGSTDSYSKRYALCNALNIVIKHLDNDGRVEDAGLKLQPISYDKVQYIREQLKETNSDERMFLRWAGVDRLEDIDERNYDRFLQQIQRKKGRP